MPYPTTELYRQAVRSGSYALTYVVDAYLGGAPIAQGLAPVGGSVTDTTRPGVRRALSLNLAPAPGLFDLLSPVGVELVPTAQLLLPGRVPLTVPMGRYDLDLERSQEGGGGISLTAPDRWVRVQRAKFIRPVSSTPGLLVVLQIVQLLQGALGAGVTVQVTATSQAVMGPLVWNEDRAKAILDLAESIGAWVFFDRNGIPTVADIPRVEQAPADWLLDSSRQGVLTGLDRSRSRTDTANVVVVSSSATDEAFTTQIVWDSDPSSPTYAGPDPINNPGAAGPFGVVPFHYETPTQMSDHDADLTARSILARTTGLASQVSAEAAPNPAADAFDVFDVLPPREAYGVERAMERHVGDTVTHPLVVDNGGLQVDGRSTRTDGYR